MKQKLTNYLPVTIVFMAAASILTYHIAYWSFWFDESFTSAMIKINFSEIAGQTARDVHPPLYYYVLKAWSNLFGTTDTALRSLSVVLALVAIFSLYGVFVKMMNKRMALLSIFFAVIGPYVVRYGQETRMYMLAAAFISVATITLYTQMNRPINKRTTRLWVVYTLSIVAALYTHYFTFPIIVAHWLYVITMDTKFEFKWLKSRKKIAKLTKGLDKNWWHANVVAGLLFAPWLPTFLSQVRRVDSGFWIPAVDHTTITDVLTKLFLFKDFNRHQSIPILVFGLLLTVFVGYLAVALWKKINRREKANMILLMGPMIISIAILFLYSLIPTTTSVFYVRYLTFFAIILYASLGYVSWLIWNYTSKRISLVFAILMLIVLLVGTQKVIGGVGRDWFKAKDGITRLNHVLVDGDVIVVSDYWYIYDSLHYLKEGVTPRYKVDGEFYGAESLLKDNKRLISSYETDVNSSTGTVWYISGNEDRTNLPNNWRKIDELYNRNDFKITRMVIE